MSFYTTDVPGGFEFLHGFISRYLWIWYLKHPPPELVSQLRCSVTGGYWSVPTAIFPFGLQVPPEKMVGVDVQDLTTF